MNLAVVGAVCFGTVVGWMTHVTLERAEKIDTRWLGSVLTTIGGAAITASFDCAGGLFGAYCIGMAGAFFFRNFVAVPFDKAVFASFKGWQIADKGGTVRFEGSKAACEVWAEKNLSSAEYSIRPKTKSA
ncbi:hypothetical protein QZM46_07650 [Burkholderia vietnamiensis]|uniref:Uncharacterized protein n=1 Tax=Burkholderia vietnamiensis TaxID=60552 RepID=A0AAW7T6V8_BURVI|nr:hypothetical protein [Burkholderia vietnamiensis]MBH9645769.1 hypothetical protein [Burkholderia vietnamiensis]MBR8008224.1 hypothetical protein [Burkholderia vietnamiensis]MDN7551224.1 hypothetical protein [Burkholderia vietnamiensis]MDN7798531.1 hypothetical protein [Burkholderia vietnamiensis]MDN8044650.1 hypothetical protein [Burkholderia vietnamiensis]